MCVEIATSADIPALSELLSTLFSQEREFTPNRRAQSRGLSQIIGNPETGAVFLARHGGQVVGMVSILFTISTALGGRVAFLEDMVVSPHCRGAGVGARLLAHATAFARAQGCKRVTLLTDGGNAMAQRFYEKHGFAVSSMIPMRLSLE